MTMPDNTPGGLRAIVAQACTDAIAALVPPGDYPLDTAIIDQAIAAIEKLVPKEQLQPSKYYDKVERSHVRDYPTEFQNGYNAAIGDIMRNFKGDK